MSLNTINQSGADDGENEENVLYHDAELQFDPDSSSSELMSVPLSVNSKLNKLKEYYETNLNKPWLFMHEFMGNASSTLLDLTLNHWEYLVSDKEMGESARNLRFAMLVAVLCLKKKKTLEELAGRIQKVRD